MTVVRIPDAIIERVKDGPQDPGPGEHLWMFTAAFRVSDETARKMAASEPVEEVHFDHENLLTLPAPGCYKCEQPFSRYLYHRKCTGSMEVLPT